VFGGRSFGTPTSNKVEISNGDIRGDVFGETTFGKGEARQNVVEIKGGNIGKSVYGGIVSELQQAIK
jgi:hypothetical protein